jgi:hypothetical protein
MSSELQVLAGGRITVGRDASAIGATEEEEWLTAPTLAGDESERSGASEDESESLSRPLSSDSGLMKLGLVIGMADFVIVREAIALARAR